MSSTGIFSYLAEQSLAVVNKLYGAKESNVSDASAQGPFVSKAVFQSCSALAKNYIMRLLFFEQCVSAQDLCDWIAGDGYGIEHAAALEELIRLRVLQESFEEDTGDKEDDDIVVLSMSSGMGIDMGIGGGHSGNGKGRKGIGGGPMRSSGEKFVMNPYFRSAFKRAILSPREPWGQQLRSLHVSSLSSSSLSTSSSLPNHTPSKEELRHQSIVKWDALLRFLVGVPGAANIIPGGTIERFVRSTDLMGEGVSAASRVASMSRQRPGGNKAGSVSGGLRNLTITEKGYAYMLKSYQEQVWIFVYELIQIATDKEELLSLLFMISYCEFGKGYPVNALTPAQRMLIVEFSQLGLVYASSSSSGSGNSSSRITNGSIYDENQVQAPGDTLLFYPASIAIHMIFRSQYHMSPQALQSSTHVGQEYNDKTDSLGLPAMGGGGDESATSNIHRGVGGFAATCESSVDRTTEMQNSLSSGLEIIVETNMQVTAYLTSELHLALLNLFVDFSVLLPNVVIGTLTRDKAKQAFRMGVRVKQIVDFLCVHAHALTRDQKPIVPANVVDQLVLWESERFRVNNTDSILMKFDNMWGFDSSAFSQVEAYANRIGMNLCSNAKKMSLVVPYDGYEQIRAFIEDQLV